jgi:non-ribosomal peptide synthetase component F
MLARPEALGFFHVDGHTRVYSGTRDLPKTHIARMHLAGHASAETWIADADADPVLVVTALPGASLAGKLVRLLPDLRALLGPNRRATVIFDRGGWSPATFAALLAASFDILTYRKGPFDPLPAGAFSAQTCRDPDGEVRDYTLAQTTVALPLPANQHLSLRQIHRLVQGGVQIPILTSRTDLTASEVCWRLSARWRQENYFKAERDLRPSKIQQKISGRLPASNAPPTATASADTSPPPQSTPQHDRRPTRRDPRPPLDATRPPA